MVSVQLGFDQLQQSSCEERWHVICMQQQCLLLLSLSTTGAAQKQL